MMLSDSEIRERAEAIAAAACAEAASEGRKCRLREAANVARYLATIQDGGSARAAMRASGISAAAVRAWLQAAREAGAAPHLRLFRDAVVAVRQNAPPTVRVTGRAFPKPVVITSQSPRQLRDVRLGSVTSQTTPTLRTTSAPSEGTRECPSRRLEPPGGDSDRGSDSHTPATRRIAQALIALEDAAARYDHAKLGAFAGGSFDSALAAATALRLAREEADRAFAMIAPGRTAPYEVRTRFVREWLESTRQGLPPEREWDTKCATMLLLAEKLRIEERHRAS